MGNNVYEALRKLNHSEKPLKEGKNDWKELKTAKDAAKFGKGSNWCVSDKKNGEEYFNAYTKDGKTFVGKGKGKNRVLGLKDKDGNITNKYDVNNMPIKEEVGEGDFEERLKQAIFNLLDWASEINGEDGLYDAIYASGFDEDELREMGFDLDDYLEDED